MSTATLPLAKRLTVARTRLSGGLGAWSALLVPSLLLIVGAAVGLAFTLDARVATERLIGLVVAGALGVVTFIGVRRTTRPTVVLLGVAAASFAGGLWIIAATGPDVFRGPLGRVLHGVFAPAFGAVRLTDPVEIANTRFIVGYNGLADLCLVTIFTCGALLLSRPPRRAAVAASVLLGASLTLLVGTGSRGGLTGLAAGILFIGLYAWPRRAALLVAVAAPLVGVLLVIGVFDKGLEFSSTTGRFAYWGDLARLLAEYPLTGVGLGVNTANRVAIQYEINPDPERIYYAHNTFVQAYLEQGPAGALGMLLIPLFGLIAALVARHHGLLAPRRPIFVAALGVLGAVEAHGLTDQVVTTNVGTALVLVALAAALGCLTPSGEAVVARLARRGAIVLGALAALMAVALAVLPAGRTLVLLNIGGLQLLRAQALDAQASGRAAALQQAAQTLTDALALDPGHPAVQRTLARVRSLTYDDVGALRAARAAADSPRIDAFDMLQIAHLYRDFGFADEAYGWAARAFAGWGRPTEDVPLLRTYAGNTLLDTEGGHRARTLAEQAEAAMRGRAFGQAVGLFQQALSFAPDNAYLRTRVGDAERAVARYGPGENRQLD